MQKQSGFWAHTVNAYLRPTCGICYGADTTSHVHYKCKTQFAITFG